jgi:hypothetical protein
VEPVLVVTIILLFASSVIVDGLVHFVGHLVKLADDYAHRPVVYNPTGFRTPPARPVLRPVAPTSFSR